MSPKSVSISKIVLDVSARRAVIYLNDDYNGSYGSTWYYNGVIVITFVQKLTPRL